MRVEFRILKFAVLIGCCSLLLVGYWRTLSNSFFPVFEWAVRIGLLAALFVGAYYLEARERKQGTQWNRAGSAIVLVTAAGMLALWLFETNRRNVPLLLRAGQFQDFNGSSLELRTDGTYRYCDIVFGEFCCYGRYQIHGPLIRLIGTSCRSGELLIASCSIDSSQRCLVWQDSHLPDMWLHEDHRSDTTGSTR